MLKTILFTAFIFTSLLSYAGDADHYTEFNIRAIRDQGPHADGSMISIKFCSMYNIYTDQDPMIKRDCYNPWDYEAEKPRLEVTVYPKGYANKKQTFVFEERDFTLREGAHSDPIGSSDIAQVTYLLKAENSKIKLSLQFRQIYFDNGSTFVDKKVIFKDKTRTIMGDLTATQPEIYSRSFSEEGSEW